MQEFHYRIAWRARGQRPGYHRASVGGGGFEFHSHAPLLAVSDPRRLDIRASLRDPLGQWVVRVHHQRSAVPVYLIADLSASMGFTGRLAKLDVLAELAASAAYSAYRTGDPFGFIGCDDRVREDLMLVPTRSKGVGAALARTLRGLTLTGPTSQGLLEASRYLGRQRALVLLVSDFHFSLALVEEIGTQFARHDVVPIVLWDAIENVGPGRGAALATLHDRESGAERTLALRSSLRTRIAEAYARRRLDLRRLLCGFGREPLFLTGEYRADVLTEYFFHDPGPDQAS